LNSRALIGPSFPGLSGLEESARQAPKADQDAVPLRAVNGYFQQRTIFPAFEGSRNGPVEKIGRIYLFGFSLG
jgi:hypothetical protein